MDSARLRWYDFARAGEAPLAMPLSTATAPPGHRRRGDGVPLYEALAQRFAGAIDAGTLRPGDRLPSVRELRAQERVSTATVMQALARLEALGYVEARPRSGSFVRARRACAAPAPSRPSASPRPVTVAGLVARVLAATRDESLVSLAIAGPAPALLPAAALGRAASAVSRPAAGAALAYELPPGSAALRRAVARRALGWGVTATADDIVVTSGAAEAIHLALAAVARPGDAVAIESPAFHGTLQALAALGLRAVEVPCGPDAGMDLDALQAILSRQRIAAVLAVPNFSNPVGSLMPDPAKRRLVRMLADAAIPLVEDDIYGDVAFDGDRPACAKAFDRGGLVLTLGSFSKTLAPGWRVGFILPGKFREEVIVRKFALNVATATGPQRAIARYLDSGAYDRHLRRLRPVLAENARRMRDLVAATFPAGTRASRPRGGYALWVELPPAVDGLELHGRALDAGVAVLPGQLFAPRGGFEHFVRLSYGMPWDDRVKGAVELVGRIAGRLAERAAPAERRA